MIRRILIPLYNQSATVRIRSLVIKNFKSLVQFEIENAPDLLVLAGPNGVGKSSVLQAIVYLKESIGPYGGWSPPGVVSSNAEFAEISAIFELCEAEKGYLSKVVGVVDPKNEYEAYIRLDKSGRIVSFKRTNELIQVFQIYDRRNYPDLGIVDYTDPHRIFRPKQITNLQIGGIDYSLDKGRRVAAGENKFDQLKEYLSQLKMADLQRIQIELQKYNTKIDLGNVCNSLEPIQKIFNELIPSKRFVDVDLSRAPARFIIDTPGGEVDIDALSSGEKEVLFVFTELYKLSLKNSIILFDEPDLHLNEEIQRRIPMQLKALGENNQIWIATHSLGLMNAVGYNELFKIENYSGKNQVAQAFDDYTKMEMFRSVAGHVGIVTLGEKIVFLEGTERTDKFILDSWFLKEKGKIVFVSSGSFSEIKGASEKVLDLLQTSSKYNYYYSIRDRDFLSEEERDRIIRSGNSRIFVWSKYHIENFLIDANVIFKVFSKLMPTDNPILNPEDCVKKIKEIAIEKRSLFISKMVEYELNSLFKGRFLKISTDGDGYMHDALTKTQEIRKQLEELLTDDKIRALVRAKEVEFDEITQNQKWLDVLPGRLLLSLLWGKYGKGMTFEIFKNLLVDEISIQQRVPSEVKDVIDTIISVRS